MKFLIAGGSGVIGTAVNGATIYIRLLYLGGLLILLAWLLTTFALRGIKVERRARAQRGSVGDIFEEHFEIMNSSRIPKLWLEVNNGTNIPNSTGSRIVTLLRGRQKRIYTARTWLTSRGGFLLGPTTVTSGDPFGIFRVSRAFPARSSLVVLPMIFRVNEFLSPPGLLPGGKVIRRKSMDSIYSKAVQCFIEEIRGETKNRTAKWDAVRVHTTLGAIAASVEQGCSVDCGPVSL